jgi:hypothetical protein
MLSEPVNCAHSPAPLQTRSANFVPLVPRPRVLRERSTEYVPVRDLGDGVGRVDVHDP